MKYPILKWIARVAMVNVGIALGVALVESCFETHITPSNFILEFLYSIIYASCIGIPLAAMMPTIWVRSCSWPYVSRWLARALTIVFGTGGGCLLAGVFLLAIYRGSYGYWASFVGSFKLSLIISIIAVAFAATYETYKARLQVTEMQLKTKELERERALKLATEARLSSLESRIHPHFLFNTINSVSSLIHEDPERAERMLTQMAGLLRFSLDSGQAGLVPLERELKIVEDYLEIEKARFNQRLRYEIAVPAGLASAPVPPLSIQTLVENSVKYAVSPRRQGATLRISAKADAGSLVLEVCDDGPGFRDFQLPVGHGLNNLQERLLALFGDQAKLDVAGTGNGASVRIEMPLISALKPAARSSADLDSTTAVLRS